MVDEDRYCIDVMRQISAISAALERVSKSNSRITSSTVMPTLFVVVKELGLTPRSRTARPHRFQSMGAFVSHVRQALLAAGAMAWLVAWSLVLGFILSGVI